MAYRPGEFVARELPPLRAVLRGVRGPGRLPGALRRADALARTGQSPSRQTSRPMHLTN